MEVVTVSEENEEIEEEEQESQNYEETDASGPSLGLVISFLMFCGIGYHLFTTGNLLDVPVWIGTVIAVFVILGSFNVNAQWEQSVTLRLGKFNRIKDAGFYLNIPFIENVIRRDIRVRSTAFTAEETLTKDNVPVNVGVVMFWKVEDPKKSVLTVQDYFGSISKAALTTLRGIIGQTTLADLLSDREKLDTKLKNIIDQKSERWGLNVESVEIREVKIPADLQNAMSRQAQAEREKTARITLAEAEIEMSVKMMHAARNYDRSPEAIKLRWMNQIHEIGLHGESAVIVIPAEMPIAGVSGLLNLERMAKKKK